MKESRIRRVVVYNAESMDRNALSNQVSAFHVQIIERRLNGLPLTAGQKITVIDQIIENLKSREAGDGI